MEPTFHCPSPPCPHAEHTRLHLNWHAILSNNKKLLCCQECLNIATAPNLSIQPPPSPPQPPARPCPMYRLNACAHAPTHPSTVTSRHAVGTSSNRFSFRFSNLLLPQTMSVRASQANWLHQSCHRSLCLGGTVGQLQAFGKCSNAKQIVSHQN